MQELNLKNNDTGLKIFVNDSPKILNMPADELELLIVDIDLHLTAYLKKKRKSKK